LKECGHHFFYLLILTIHNQFEEKRHAPSDNIDLHKHSLETFVDETNERLPGPLCVLLHLIMSHRSKRIRTSGAGLCRIILVETNHVWMKKKQSIDINDLKMVPSLSKKDEKEEKNKLMLTALETCLSFLNDEYGK